MQGTYFCSESLTMVMICLMASMSAALRSGEVALSTSSATLAWLIFKAS